MKSPKPLRIVEALESESGPYDPLELIKEVNGELRPEDWRVIGYYDDTLLLGIGHPLRALITVYDRGQYRECYYIGLRDRKAWMYAIHGLHRDVRVAGECKVCTAPYVYQDAMPVDARCAGCGSVLGDRKAVAEQLGVIEKTIKLVADAERRTHVVNPSDVITLMEEVPNGLL